jgi:hypothetical protein
MKKFNEFITEQKLFEEYLEEKLIMLNNGRKDGQIVFLAGGAGSGKGFAASNFMEKEKFKVRDVDEWKKTFMALADIIDKPEKHAKMMRAGSKIPKGEYDEIRGLDLKKPADVGKLHMFVKKLNLKNKTLDVMLDQLKDRKKLPNIMFDITAKDTKDVEQFMPRLLKAGYNPANIHLVWVLTDYEIAIKQNADRERVVASDIMLATHQGASETVYKYVTGKGKKMAINGEIHVILNNKENTVMFTPSSNDRTSKISGKVNGPVVKDFTYLTLKKRGKPMTKEDKVMKQLYHWVINNIPKSDFQKALSDTVK